MYVCTLYVCMSCLVWFGLVVRHGGSAFMTRIVLASSFLPSFLLPSCVLQHKETSAAQFPRNFFGVDGCTCSLVDGSRHDHVLSSLFGGKSAHIFSDEEVTDWNIETRNNNSGETGRLIATVTTMATTTNAITRQIKLARKSPADVWLPISAGDTLHWCVPVRALERE